MKRLADQTMLGNILMKNRFVRAAVGDFTNGGHLSENNYELYRNLADGGAALLMTGFSVVDAQEQSAVGLQILSNRNEMVVRYIGVNRQGQRDILSVPADVLHLLKDRGITVAVQTAGIG